MKKKIRFSRYSPILKNGIGKIQIIAGLLAILFLMLWAPLACNSGNQPALQDQPQTAVVTQENQVLDGAALLAERCSACHGINRVKQTRKTSEAWEKTVSRMMSKGARLTEDEKTVLLDYLSKNYAP